MPNQIIFINTFEPVSPIYRTVLPKLLETIGFNAIALMCENRYRQSSSCLETEFCQFIYTPHFLNLNKRWSTVIYFIFAPFYLFLLPSKLFIFLSQPPLFYILGSAIARIRNVPYILHVMDLYPDILICQNVFKKQGIIDILLSKLSLHAFKNANKTIVLGRCMQEKLVDKGIDVEQIQIIPNWAFEIYPVEPKNNIFIRTNNLDGKFIVLYSGNMGIAHKFETLLRAAQNLISYEEIIFIFVGDGVRKQEIYCQSLVQKNILMLNYQDPELLPHSLSSGDVHFISLDPCFSGVMVPSKLYGSLATGKPIIYEGSDSDEAALVIQEHQCGEIVKPGDADNLLTVILSYFNCREKRSLHGKNALYASEKVFFSKKVTKSYIDCISEVVNS